MGEQMYRCRHGAGKLSPGGIDHRWPRACRAAEGDAPSLPVFTPHPSDWSPDYTLFPYNLWQTRVTPEQITAQRESCQWFNAQYDILMTQVFGFQRFLGDRHDAWSTTGVQAAADVVVANLDQSGAFLDSRAHTLFIINYPDQSEYSPLYNGDSIYHLWYQITQISDKMKRENALRTDQREHRDRQRVRHRDSTVASVRRGMMPALARAAVTVGWASASRRCRSALGSLARYRARSATLNGNHHGAWNNPTILTIAPR